MVLTKEIKEKLANLLSEGLTALKLSINPTVQTQLLSYIELLHKWNNAYNLTAIRDPVSMVTRHLLDSLSIAPFIKGQRIIDIGSGAGLPGIPLACLFPEKIFYLLDSNGKKTRFMIQAKAELQLKNIEVVHARVENYQPPERFDTVTARAFTTINDMIDISQHLLAKEGQFLIMKGIYPENELQGFKWPFQVYPLHVPGLNEQRHLVCIGSLSCD